jgi:glycosyltransferase involved in cell wall biosynthesis
MKHILVLGVQVPFVYGGAEILNETLIKEINKRENLKAEIVMLPFKWYPEKQLLNDILAWRLLDLSESNGIKIDLVISTKFPSYAIRHPNKALWLLHQYRPMYDLANTQYDIPNSTPQKREIRDELKRLDNKFLSEYKTIYTISNTVSNRLKKYNNFNSTPLLPPPALSSQIVAKEYGDYILYIGRLDPLKRVDLLIEAIAITPRAKAIIIGKGAEFDRLYRLIREKDIEDRCSLLGFVSDSKLIQYLSLCRAVFYAPIDEDYGYATIEAFLAQRPVITCRDSGEVKNMVEESRSGFVSDNTRQSISSVLDKIY